jgi:alkanesulfonate monooxygenase SsuD/methylene tetrahydromethanopterin reductase-like flavin-dependent oxidoreductase (luciferase family)
MKLGIFDHMDRGPLPLGEFYESRLRLIEEYDRAGFHAYHVAEHHATPLGHAPSPSVFLSAVAQRTRNLRFGPLVYTLPLYHPQRLIDEICMLDQMSGGRLELGVGRGISPIELTLFGLDPATAPAMYREALEILLLGLRAKTLSFQGVHYQYRDVPIELEPVQKPHPPLWYGLGTPDSVPFVLSHRMNVVSNLDAANVRPITDRYRAEWERSGLPAASLPLMGTTRHIVVAETEREAMEIAERGYARWRESFLLLWVKHGSLRPSPAAMPRETFAQAERDGRAVAGTIDKVTDYLKRTIADAGINYLLCRFAFGDVTHDEALQSTRLFARGVMPHLV